MLNTRLCNIVAIVVSAIGLGSVDIALAQSGAGLILRPWSETDIANVAADVTVFDTAETDGDSPEGLDIWIVDTKGRIRTEPSRRAMNFGYELYYMGLDSDAGSSVLPNQLIDASFGVGMGVGLLGDWQIAATAGFGSASDEPFEDSEGLYAKGNLIATLPVDDTKSWQIILNYNGNRTFLPDVPLPALAFNHVVSDRLMYSAGIPFTNIMWKPFWPVTVDLHVVVPTTVDAKVTLGVFPDLDVYGRYVNDKRAFHSRHVNDLRGASDRLFFEQQRAEAGLVWRPFDSCVLNVAGGYAFEQEFTTGWDSRDDDTYVELDNALYFRVGFDVAF